MTSELIIFNHLRCHSSSTALGTRNGYWKQNQRGTDETLHRIRLLIYKYVWTKKCFTVKHNKLVITIIVVNNTDFFFFQRGAQYCGWIPHLVVIVAAAAVFVRNNCGVFSNQKVRFLYSFWRNIWICAISVVNLGLTLLALSCW